MDAEHRHELKENDLAEFITHFGQWWAQHGNKLLVALLLVVTVWGGKYWFDDRSQKKKEAAWLDLAQTTSPDGYRSVAMSYQNPAVRALAYLRGADLLLTKAAVGPDNKPNGETAAEPAQTVDDTDAAAALESAELMYQAVLDDAGAHRAYKLNAHLGLAAIAEGRSQWDQARDLYNAVIEQSGAGYATIREQAQMRIAMLERLKRPVVFGPEPPAAETVDQEPGATTAPAGSDEPPPADPTPPPATP